MRFVILRILRHNELGMFHEYRRQKKERAKQRAINFDGDVVDRVFPAAKNSDKILMTLRYETDAGIGMKEQWVKRQEKNWRLEGNCPEDACYAFVDPGCLFAMVVDSGKRPADGAWAVFPADSPVTVNILADGESSRLAGSSMIALHGDEGARTLALLQRAKPALFDPSAAQAPTKKTTPKGSTTVQKTAKGVKLPPSAKRLPQILAAVHAGLKTAVADIVDNSISHDATRINIVFGRPDDGHGRWMAIVDNGCGMDETKLAEAMRIGSEADYDEGNLGKYGFGLKGASWSQSPAFTVVTRAPRRTAYDLTWDTADMADWESKRGMLPKWAAKAANVGDHGTAVVWTRMYAPRNGPVARGADRYTAEVQDLGRHLGLVFHRFLDGKVAGRKKVIININGTAVVSHDPVGHRLTSAYNAETVRVATAGDDERVKIQAHLLPAEYEIEGLHGADTAASQVDLDALGLWKSRNLTQGIYVYRNDRLISWGGWHDIWTTLDEKRKLARVTVSFGRALDDQFQVDISKESVSLPQSLLANIKRIADVARADSLKKYSKANRPARTIGNGETKGGTAPNGQGKATGAGAGPSVDDKQPPKGVGKPTGGIPGGPPLPQQRFTVRIVRNGNFSWKISEDLAGNKEIQIGDGDADLCAMTEAIKADANAVTAFVSFLGRLDNHDVQRILAGKRTAT